MSHTIRAYDKTKPYYATRYATSQQDWSKICVCFGEVLYRYVFEGCHASTIWRGAVQVGFRGGSVQVCFGAVLYKFVLEGGYKNMFGRSAVQVRLELVLRR